MFDPVKSSKNIKEEFISYISTSFAFEDKNLRRQFEKELENIVSKGPYLETNDVFKSGKSIKELIADGVLSPLFEDLEIEKRRNGHKEVLPLTRPLYYHQQEAIRLLVNGENAVISTGTGSGKTNCFLIPVINDLLKEKEAGTLGPGVRALFIYPMNALANDQLKNLRRLLMDYEDITFGVYNGATENEEEQATAVYKSMFATEPIEKLRNPLKNEILSRQKMKETPPNILFTNYAMLEHLLLRPNDDVLFTSSDFKFVVLDEAHIYSGATGIETAILLRRLRARIHSSRPTQFVLTSATLGTSDKSYGEIIEFANNLSGAKFKDSNIIMGTRESYQIKSEGVEYPYELFTKLADEKNSVSEVLDEFGIAHEDRSESELLYDLLDSSKQYQDFRRGITRVTSLEDIKEIMNTSIENCVAFISICSRANKNGKALIDARYHFFIRSLEGCFITLAPEKQLFLTRTRQNGDYQVFEVAVCDDCGRFALVGKIEDGFLKQVAKVSDSADFYYLYDEKTLDLDEDEEIESRNPEVYLLCPHCGAVVEEKRLKNKPCDHDPKDYIRIAKAKRPNDDKSENLPKCVNCHSGHYQRIYLGIDAPTSVLATALYEELPELSYEEVEETPRPVNNIFQQAALKNKKKSKRKARQFLVFSDSRQEAAKFACYLGTSYQEFLRRRGICNVIKNDYKAIINQGYTIGDFVSKLSIYFANKGTFAASNKDDSNLTVISTRNAWVAMINELARTSSHTSLTSLGVLQFEYIGNDALYENIARQYKISEKDAKDLLSLLALEIVKAGAIYPESDTDINHDDREYIFYTPKQSFLTDVVSPTEKKKTITGWYPRNRKGLDSFYPTRRLTYVQEYLKITPEEAAEFLKGYFKYLTDPDNKHHMIDLNHDGNYVLPAKYFRVRVRGDKSIKWYKCPKCGRVSPYQRDGHCISISCGHTVEEINPEELSRDNHFSRLYLSDLMAPLFIKEHTAQLSKKESTLYQEQFIKKEINALSCSTTFEMGVDVGDLETVFLRDVPPLPSNYAQRAGRAGRSLESVAYCLTFAKLSSHDLAYYKDPRRMISRQIRPPLFKIDNEKIVRRHVYAVALSMFFKDRPELYNHNDAELFLNKDGYLDFLKWLDSKPERLKDMLKRSIPDVDNLHERLGLNDFSWLEEFKGEDGVFSVLIREYKNNIKDFEKVRDSYLDAKDLDSAHKVDNKLTFYKKNKIIDFLARGSVLPRYGFPVDTVELKQNVTADGVEKLQLSRDLSIAIAEYAPSSEVIADGHLYTSRYIKKPNTTSRLGYKTAYIATCPNEYCQAMNYSLVPIPQEGRKCSSCDHILEPSDFQESIEPVAGFVTESTVKPVPLSRQAKSYRTEDVYIGNTEAKTIQKHTFEINGIEVDIESTTNDSLLVKSTKSFYVCPTCGYSIAEDETVSGEPKVNKAILNKAHDITIEKAHENYFSQSKCGNHTLKRYTLHHVFNTDVAKINFGCDTSDRKTMLSSMYAILYTICDELNIERKDLRACLSAKVVDYQLQYSIIIYDAVPGGAGHSRRLVTHGGMLLRYIINKAYINMISCKCDPSCYNCLRSYENQRVHEELDRKLAADFLLQLVSSGDTDHN